MIAPGAVVVAISNINYNRARDSENKLSKATQVRAMLHNEIQSNNQVLEQMDAGIAAKTVRIETFDTTAWQTVSTSDLLLGLPDEELASLLQTYRLINRANSLHAKILDTMVGVASALSGSSNARDLFFTELSSILNQLKPLMKSLVEQPRAHAV